MKIISLDFSPKFCNLKHVCGAVATGRQRDSLHNAFIYLLGHHLEKK